MSTKEKIQKEGGEEKKRGASLTIWLILLFSGNVNTFLGLFSRRKIMGEFFNGVGAYSLYFNITLLLIILNIASIIFLFFWKKWAFFSLCIGYLLIFILSTIMVPLMGIYLGIGLVFAISVLYILLRPKWEFLE